MIVIPILPMRKPRLREVMLKVQDHTTIKHRDNIPSTSPHWKFHSRPLTQPLPLTGRYWRLWEGLPLIQGCTKLLESRSSLEPESPNSLQIPFITGAFFCNRRDRTAVSSLGDQGRLLEGVMGTSAAWGMQGLPDHIFSLGSLTCRHSIIHGDILSAWC